MSMKTLRKALKDTKRDEFKDGTVIRWVASGKYTYAALKTPAGWFTTARALPEAYQRVPQVVTFEQLIALLSKSEVSAVEVATEWTPVEASK